MPDSSSIILADRPVAKAAEIWIQSPERQKQNSTHSEYILLTNSGVSIEVIIAPIGKFLCVLVMQAVQMMLASCQAGLFINAER